MTAEEQAAADAAAKATKDTADAAAAKAASDAAAKAASDAAAKTAADAAAALAAAKPVTLEGMTAERLREIYKSSPEMFAGLVPEVKKEAPQETPPPKSAAPKFGDVEIKLPEDVPVNKETIDAYLVHAKEVGLSAAQVQAEIDFQSKSYRAAVAKQAPLTQAQQDAANVEALKRDFGASYEANMATARGAFDKIKDRHPELEAKLKTSDPAYVKLLLELGNADRDDSTPNRGAPRNGTETDAAEKDAEKRLQERFNNSPQLFTS